MKIYIAKRIGYGLFVLFGLSVFSFILIHLVPGDPAKIMLGVHATPEQVAALRETLGLNQPLYIQYVDYVNHIIHLDLGESYKTGRPVLTEILLRFPATLELAVAGMFLAMVFGITLGILAARFKDSIIDVTSMSISIFGVSIPNFWLGIMLILFFTVQLGWLPVAGGSGLSDLILPAVTLGVTASAVISRITRSEVLEILQNDFIRTARSKGLGERAVLFTHALRNAMIPIVTIAGLQMAGLLGGTVIIEKVFSWPGLGSLAVNSIFSRDFPMVQGITLFFGFVFVVINLLVDILYGVIDPRVNVTGGDGADS